MVRMRYYELEIDLDRELSNKELVDLDVKLAEFPVTDIFQDRSKILHVKFRFPDTKGTAIWPLWAIVALVSAIPVGITGWKLFTWEPEPVDIMKWVLPLGAVLLGGYLIYKQLK